MEIPCPHCDTPFAKRRAPRCQTCEAEMRRDYAKVNRFEMPFSDYRRKWRVPRRLAEVVERPLLLGAVPIGGKVFFWRGTPYIAARYREEIKAIL